MNLAELHRLDRPRKTVLERRGWPQLPVLLRGRVQLNGSTSPRNTSPLGRFYTGSDDLADAALIGRFLPPERNLRFGSGWPCRVDFEDSQVAQPVRVNEAILHTERGVPQS